MRNHRHSRKKEKAEMKPVNLTIVTTIIATFAISMFAFQLTTVEAGNNVSPSATPNPRKKGSKTIQPPITKSTSKRTAQKPAGLIKELTFPELRKRNAGYWELGEDGVVKKTKVKAKVTGYQQGDTLTHERRKQPRKRSTQRRMHKPIK